MPKFSYIGRKPNGEKEAGIIDGATQDEVIFQLQKNGLIITSIIPFDVGRAETKKQAQDARTKKSQFTHAAIKTVDLVVFARQLALLLGAGVSLLRSLDIISKQVDSKRMFDVVAQIRQDMEGGRTLKDALAKFPTLFNALWINLVETGEASGNLPMVLDKLAFYLEADMAFVSKIISALMYPGILMFVSVSAVFFFVLKIVPTFAGILKNFGVELPLATRVVIGISDFLLHKSYVLVAIIAGIVVLYKVYSKKSPFDRWIEEIKMKLPIFGEFLRFILLERFATTMAILVESGVPILYALEISERSAGSLKMAEAIGYIKKSVREGRSMAIPMEKSEFFTPMVVQMIAIGEEIGELSSMLKRISKYYQEYVETFVTRLATIFEPLMIVFIGIVIGAMVISIFLPIFSMALMRSG